jgi:outer membrane protein TolC
MERALAALREAMGVEPDFCFQLVETTMPSPPLTVTKEVVIGLALERRGEIVQATSAACIADLEIQAQGATHLPTARTFASGSDIHARPIPQGISNTEYRPGAIGLEMPPLMAGPRKLRMERASALAARAAAVVDKTRHLVALEAEDAFLKYQETARNLPLTKEAADKAQPLAMKIQASLAGGQNVRPKEVLDALIHGEQSRAQYNETLHRYLHGLAALERVTAGGVQLPH